MRYLKQSTAIEVKVGPFLDEADGKTAETSLTLSQADVRLAKNGADWGQKNESTSMVHEENGWYRCLLDTTDTDTLGILMLAIHESGALPVWVEFHVVTANVYDSLFGSGDVLDVSVTQWLGSAAATPTVAGVPEVDVTHIGGSAVTAASGIPEVKVASIANGAVTAAAVATGAIDADALATDAAQEIADALLDRSAGVETGLTVRQWFRLAASALFGKVSGAGGATTRFRDVGDTKDRITASVDTDGNRTAITRDAT